MKTLRLAIVSALCLVSLAAFAQSDKFEVTSVNIWSDGTRLSGNLFRPSDLKEGEKRPAVILCHGWGGLKAHLNLTTAPKIAEAGYFVLTFDYRGWGESDSKLVLKEPMPELGEDRLTTVKVEAIREVVDPDGQVEDIRNAISYLEGEPGVDTKKIGLWGSSFGGGLVVWMAAHDDRVACIFAQAAAMNARVGLEATPGMIDMVKSERTKRARGELQPVPQGVHTFPNLRGTPYLDRFIDFIPVAHAHKIKVPVMVVDAEHEELFDNNDHGVAVYNAVKDNVPSKYKVIPDIKHYGVYREAFDECTSLAIAWYDEHLKK